MDEKCKWFLINKHDIWLRAGTLLAVLYYLGYSLYIVDLLFILPYFIQAIDKANGYIYGTGEERNIQRLLSCAVGAEWEHERIGIPRDTFMRDEEEDEENEDVLAMLARQNQKTWSNVWGGSNL